ncbi:Dyp-type peroxidase [Actinoplanes sp. URMC 104]|uniref:Dyp-type peroxidase n=1 Tax=Actinoplanes sp. URMC 104 TaxID=3423409 RepID=UPI003F1BFA07
MTLSLDPQEIQGNILRPFGGKHQAFVALSFRHDRARAREWLGRIADRVTRNDAVPPRGENRLPPGRTLLNVGLTATGLYLLHPETAGVLAGHDAFWSGPLGPRLDASGNVTTAPALLGDVGTGDPQNWVVGGLDVPVDALLTIAAGDYRTIRDAVARAKSEAWGLRVLRVEIGESHRDSDNRRSEHFGFTDGISQPTVRGFPETEETGSGSGSPVIAAGEFLLGYPGERRPPSWAPRPVAARWMHGGSFQVFRRIEQDAKRWWEHMESLADKKKGETADDVAARALGRRLDGTPLATGGDYKDNDFDYKSDPDGDVTPRYAHIRKVNPRDDMVFRDRGRKLLRRGIPYGPEFKRAAPDSKKRGMLFNAYMASIEDQFEFILRNWSNSPSFPQTDLVKYGRVAAGTPERVDGLDPVLGDSSTAAAKRLPADVVRDIPKPAYGGFLTTTGAVYAFAPTVTALRQLAGDDELN